MLQISSTMINKRHFSLLLFLVFAFFLIHSFPVQAETQKPYILVSIPPHKFFVEKIAGDTATVNFIVPAGASAHTYEPTPKQMIQASTAAMWFRMGEPFEDKIIPALKGYNPSMKIVDLRKGLDLIKTDPSKGHTCCHHHAFDPHFWLSARLAKIQAQTIAEALISAYPQHKSLYEERLNKFVTELTQLDNEIADILKNIQNRNILVSHPAYAYFCRDYDLTQYSIEFEGKDPTPKQLNNILNLARNLHIKTIFIQQQYSSKGARLIASEIGAKVVNLDPYAEQYIDCMLKIAHAFSEG